MNKYRLEINLIDENNKSVDRFTLIMPLDDLYDDAHTREWSPLIINMIETQQYHLHPEQKIKTPIADSIMDWVMEPADIKEPKLKGEDIF